MEVKSKRLQAKDLINVGIFTAIYFVIFFAGMMLGSVSYTHLDVYKRQVLGCATGKCENLRYTHQPNQHRKPAGDGELCYPGNPPVP